jgi:hypothetical protein
VEALLSLGASSATSSACFIVCVLWWLCAGRFRVRRVPNVSVFHTCVQPPPIAWKRFLAASIHTLGLKTMKTLHPDPPYVKPIPHPENRFMALTSNCDDMPTLFVDTHAPLDVLYDAASYRIQAVTQVMENLSMRGSIECQSFILSDFAHLIVEAEHIRVSYHDREGKLLQSTQIKL